MKITIQRTISTSNASASQSASEYMKIVFAHISHHGWIQNTEVTTSGNNEVITVTMLPQGETNPKDLEPEVRQAILMRGNLKLISIEGVKNHIKLPGLRLVSKTDTDGVTYRVNPIFATYLASDLTKAAKCAKPETSQVDFMFEETSEGSNQYTYTGVACISSNKLLAAKPRNVYNHFALSVFNNEELRQRIIKNPHLLIELSITPEGTSSISIFEEEVTSASVEATSNNFSS